MVNKNKGVARKIVAALLGELLAGKLTKQEIQAETGWAESTARLWIREMRGVRTPKGNRLLRIAGWPTCRSGSPMPAYRLNTEDTEDLSRPHKLTPAQRSKRYRKMRAGATLKLKRDVFAVAEHIDKVTQVEEMFRTLNVSSGGTDGTSEALTRFSAVDACSSGDREDA